MKTTAQKIMILTVVGTLMACGNNKKQPEVHTVTHQESEMPTGGDLDAVAEKAEVRFNEAKTGKIYSSYLAVKGALVNTDAAAAQAKATAMVAVLKTANAGEKALVAATAIASNADVNKQRESFEVLTVATETLLKDAIASGEVYKQFCPMAFDGRGAYWLSDSKEIRNPYFGDKMLKCGLVQETFK